MSPLEMMETPRLQARFRMAILPRRFGGMTQSVFGRLRDDRQRQELVLLGIDQDKVRSSNPLDLKSSVV